MSVRALVLWVGRQGWSMRFRRRTPEECSGELQTGNELIPFHFYPEDGRIELPDRTIFVDSFGWEVNEEGQIVFRSRVSDDPREDDAGNQGESDE